ncbi:MAG: histidine phosphatase family protein [Geodermatophilaceae bacterium]|nr:histidine phosphatase family protein [Geodermatophilaceae bacterium]
MTETTAHTLVLLRHAKAADSGVTDHDRELSAQGQSEAAAVGRWLVEAGRSFDAVLCSTATRTRQTWNGIAAAGVSTDDVRFDRQIYDGGPEEVLGALAEVRAGACSVLVIGHAPTIPELADLLADHEASDAAALEALQSSFPSGCLAVLNVSGPWAELAPATATLSEVATPRP